MYDYSNYGSPSFDGYQSLLGSGTIADDVGGATAPVAEEGSDFFAGSTETDGLELYTYSALSLTSMAAGASDPVAALVNEMSLNFRGRPCTSAEIDAYLYSIRNSGQTLPAIGVGMAGSSESQRYLADQAHTPVINAIFRLYFGRDADPAGLAGCLESMRNGASVMDISNWCAGWPESQNHFADLKNEPIVRSIFRVFFGHEPAPDQMAPTLAAMRNGTTRQDFANWAAAWPESQQYLAGMDHISIVNSIYREYFGREGEISNVATVAGWMDAGASAADIANWAAGWPESQNHFADKANAPTIQQIYHLFFGHDAEGAGLVGNLESMRNGLSVVDISNWASQWPEAHQYLANSANEPVVRAIFHLYFGREADATSLAFCLDTLKNGASLTDVMNWAAAWPESANFFTSVYGNNGPATVDSNSLDTAARAKITAWQNAANSNAPKDVVDAAYADAFLALGKYKDYVGTLGLVDYIGKPFTSRPYTVLGSTSEKYGMPPYQVRHYEGQLYPGEHLIYYLDSALTWIYREPGYFSEGFIPGIQRWPAPESLTLQQVLTEKALKDNVNAQLHAWLDAENDLKQIMVVTQQQVDSAKAALDAASENDRPSRQQEYSATITGFASYQVAVSRVRIAQDLYNAASVAQTAYAIDGSNDVDGDGIGDFDFDPEYLSAASAFGNSDEMVWVPDERDEDGNVISTGYLTWADATSQNPPGSSAFDPVYQVQQQGRLVESMGDIVSDAISWVSDTLASLKDTFVAMLDTATAIISTVLGGIYAWAQSSLATLSKYFNDGFNYVPAANETLGAPVNLITKDRVILNETNWQDGGREVGAREAISYGGMRKEIYYRRGDDGELTEIPMTVVVDVFQNVYYHFYDKLNVEHFMSPPSGYPSTLSEIIDEAKTKKDNNALLEIYTFANHLLPRLEQFAIPAAQLDLLLHPTTEAAQRLSALGEPDRLLAYMLTPAALGGSAALAAAAGAWAAAVASGKVAGLVGGAVGGATADATLQAFFLATGLQDEFSFKQLAASIIIGGTVGEIAQTWAAWKSNLEWVTAAPKMSRPDPASYLPAEYIAEHLARFEGGASRLTPTQNFQQWGLGQRDGTTFVMPTAEVDALLSRFAGNTAGLEDALGLERGFLSQPGNTLTRVDIPNPRAAGLRMPSGKEAGANPQWIPGGKLPTGYNEAVIDGGSLPAGSYNAYVL